MAPFWHRWSYFSIINLSVFHLADKCFAIANLINLRIILFLEYRKTPETQGFWGILRLDTECTPDTQFISSYNYSMIVATRPDPTVRPPSRYQTSVLQCANGDFSCNSRGKIQIFRCVRVVFGDFVIMVLSHIILFQSLQIIIHHYARCIFIYNLTFNRYSINLIFFIIFPT